MGCDPADPTAIRSIAVTADDAVTALEARRQRDEPVVLRVTPPFSGRMRARLHVRVDGAGDPDALHVVPGRLFREDAPAYPRPAATGDELRADPTTEYTVDRHHDHHAEAVAAWRDAVRDHFVESIEIETGGGSHRVEVAVLG